MKHCPECYLEFVDEVSTCHRCNVGLVDGPSTEIENEAGKLKRRGSSAASIYIYLILALFAFVAGVAIPLFQAVSNSFLSVGRSVEIVVFLFLSTLLFRIYLKKRKARNLLAKA